MVVHQPRSKRPSAASFTSTPRKREFTLFVDRDLGRRIVPEALRAAGATVEVHDDHFPQNTHDEVWLKEVGEKGWVVIRKDKDIRARTAERAALLSAGVRAFILRTGGLSGPQNGQILARAYPRIIKFCLGNRPPFVAGISPGGRIQMLFRESARRRRRRTHKR